jgi:hypothetical protein
VDLFEVLTQEPIRHLTDFVVGVRVQLEEWTQTLITGLCGSFSASRGDLRRRRRALHGELVEPVVQPLRVSDQFNLVAEFARATDTVRDALLLGFQCERTLDGFQ